MTSARSAAGSTTRCARGRDASRAGAGAAPAWRRGGSGSPRWRADRTVPRLRLSLHALHGGRRLDRGSLCEHLAVSLGLLEQLVVGAFGDDAPAVEKDDPV